MKNQLGLKRCRNGKDQNRKKKGLLKGEKKRERITKEEEGRITMGGRRGTEWKAKKEEGSGQKRKRDLKAISADR